MVLAGRTKLRVSKNFFRGDIFLYLLNIFAITVPKLKTKNIKNYSSILAFVKHWNWLDDSPPLTFWVRAKLRRLDLLMLWLKAGITKKHFRLIKVLQKHWNTFDLKLSLIRFLKKSKRKSGLLQSFRYLYFPLNFEKLTNVLTDIVNKHFPKTKLSRKQFNFAKKP